MFRDSTGKEVIVEERQARKHRSHVFKLGDVYGKVSEISKLAQCKITFLETIKVLKKKAKN